MVALIDTNVLIDALASREPFATNARRIIEKCAKREIVGIVAAHSFPDMFYILRRNLSAEKRRELLKHLCKIFYVISLDKDKILSALDNAEFSDFEDCLQDLCATEAFADCIVTRNKADYVASSVKAVAPDEFLSMSRG